MCSWVGHSLGMREKPHFLEKETHKPPWPQSPFPWPAPKTAKTPNDCFLPTAVCLPAHLSGYWVEKPVGLENKLPGLTTGQDAHAPGCLHCGIERRQQLFSCTHFLEHRWQEHVGLRWVCACVGAHTRVGVSKQGPWSYYYPEFAFHTLKQWFVSSDGWKRSLVWGFKAVLWPVALWVAWEGMWPKLCQKPQE